MCVFSFFWHKTSSLAPFLRNALPITESGMHIIASIGEVSPLERKLKNSVRFRRRQRTASGLGMIGLGAYLAFAETN